MAATQLPLSLPWQQQIWDRLVGLWRQEKIPHALLLTGDQGIGKLRFAQAFAALLLCQSPRSDLPCGRCKQCDLLLAASHPDLREVSPQESGRHIKVDQIRALVDFLSQTAQQGGYRVSIIEPAETMNINAANALLKSLEEPGSRTLLLLVSHAPSRLPATIRSRCQRVSVTSPTMTESLAWLRPLLPQVSMAEEVLAETNGRPLAALAVWQSGLQEQRQQLQTMFTSLLRGEASPLQVAEACLSMEIVDVLGWLELHCNQWLKAQLCGESVAAVWSTLKARDVKVVYGFVDELKTLRSQLEAGMNPNKQLALEQVFIRVCDIFTT